MAKVQYVIPFPDGTSTTKITPDYVVHSLAVIARMKLRRILPPLNPDNKDEEVRYHRYEGWVLVATTDTAKRAAYVQEHLVYKASTLETQVIEVAPEPYVPSPEKVAAGLRLREASLNRRSEVAAGPVAERMEFEGTIIDGEDLEASDEMEAIDLEDL